MNVKRILDALHRNNEENRNLLLDLEREINEPRTVARKVESPTGVHISNIRPNQSMDAIVSEITDRYGAADSIQRGNTWINIEFVWPESQENCLKDSKILERSSLIIFLSH